jgi:predicted metal-dependent phosphoesterase TrpH
MYKRILYRTPALADLKKEYAFADMHIHTKYSHDSLTNIKHLLKKASELKIGLAITDHSRAEGAIEACKQKKVLIIPGIEVNSRENKEILLYFYSPRDLWDFYSKNIEKELTKLKHHKGSMTKTMAAFKLGLGMDEIVELADEYNCVKSIPHPFTFPRRRSHKFFAKHKRRKVLGKIDAIEVLNASMLPRMNKLATNWAVKEDKAYTGGSDAHIIPEVGHALVACKADNAEGFLDYIRKKKNFVIGREIKFSVAAKNFRHSMNVKKHKNLEFDEKDFAQENNDWSD